MFEREFRARPDRHTYILSRLDKNGSVTLEELARELRVSITTIQRDLRLLADQHCLRRVRGGAVVLTNSQ